MTGDEKASSCHLKENIMHRILRKLYRETVKLLSKLGLKSTVIKYKGSKFKVPLINGIGAGLHLISNDHMYKALKLFLTSRQGAIIDIGTNIGLYLLTLKAIDSQTDYYGFEPNPLCHFYNMELIRLNHFQNVHIFPFALSDNKELCRFYAARLGDKMGSLNIHHRDNKRLKNYSFDLLTFKGDEFFDLLKLESMCAIKIDVEGSELKVLKGMQNTIMKYKPFIFCEVMALLEPTQRNFTLIKDNRISLFEILKDMDYQIMEIQPNDSVREISSNKQFLLSKSNDYIFTHCSNKEQLKRSMNPIGEGPAN